MDTWLKNMLSWWAMKFLENDGCFAFGDCNEVHLMNVIMSLFFQAFLTRAAYYGLQGKYSKAILNCNEAIKLQPNSIRTYLYRYHRRFTLVIFSPSLVYHQVAYPRVIVGFSYFSFWCYSKIDMHVKILDEFD